MLPEGQDANRGSYRFHKGLAYNVLRLTAKLDEEGGGGGVAKGDERGETFFFVQSAPMIKFVGTSASNALMFLQCHDYKPFAHTTTKISNQLSVP